MEKYARTYEEHRRNDAFVGNGEQCSVMANSVCLISGFQLKGHKSKRSKSSQNVCVDLKSRQKTHVQISKH